MSKENSERESRMRKKAKKVKCKWRAKQLIRWTIGNCTCINNGSKNVCPVPWMVAISHEKREEKDGGCRVHKRREKKKERKKEGSNNLGPPVTGK